MRAKRLSVAFLASVLLRYPYWAFIFASGSIQHLKPWANDFQLMCKWDCGLYSGLSVNYEPSPFFPLFPLLIRLFNNCFPFLSANDATILTSNIFTILAGIMTLFLGEQLWTDSKKYLYFGKHSWLLLLAVSLFPHSHFWMTGFSEPVFYFLIACTLIASIQEKWLLASVGISLTAVLRPPGIWLLAGFLAFVAFKTFRKQIGKAKFTFYAMVAVLPFLCFLFWLNSKTGNPFYFYQLQTTGWGRKLSVWDGMREHLPRFDEAVLYLYLSLFASYTFFKRKDDIWKLIAIFTFALADLPLFVGGFLSYDRFMSANIGLLIYFSEFAGRSDWIAIFLVVLAVTRLALQVFKASFGVWVG